MSRFFIALVSYFFMFSLNANACNEQAALIQFYQWPQSTQVFILNKTNNNYDVKLIEEDGAVCTGAKAYVDSQCRVVVVHSAYCAYPN